ncbi:meiosis-specific protein MEI4 [Protopterus annectens]|uniref:meiosis-specific protein MEI4 n=1 Tax=Protopterus annectens TaxID=7888 RepID=UPI001CFA165D|nr:meiosis-specific protein MEI4 [Protopterus annectens]
MSGEDLTVRLQIWYYRTCKLALALAVISTRPPGKTSKEYAEFLVATVSCQGTKWRSKVEALEAEVFRLRQEALLSKLSSRTKESLSIEDSISCSTLQLCSKSASLFSVATEHGEDSGCDVSTLNSLSGSSNLARSEPNYLSCTLPLLTLPGDNHNQQSSKEKHLEMCTHFLQNLIGLKKLSEAGSVTTAGFIGSDFSIVTDSVSQLIQGMSEFYRSPKDVFFDMFFKEAPNVLAFLIEETHLPKSVLNQCSKKLEDFQKELLKLILENGSINRVR